nr:MAG TPA: hypothetical protein [Caudoviricetes sp.]
MFPSFVTDKIFLVFIILFSYLILFYLFVVFIIT